jgi:outer membrane protein assembly factor BamB
VFALGRNDGKVAWSFELDDARVTRALVFVADAGEVAAFETQQGHMLWHEPFTGHGLGVVALAVRDASAQGDRSG